ncbi:MAG: gas vesicle protein GvpN [Xenococcaceae cyanobacterium]
MVTVLNAHSQTFINTPAVQNVAQRALKYLQSGYSVHLRGVAGVGKTTLALHIANLRQQPIVMFFGDDEFKSSDMIGNNSGYSRKKVVDNFIHTVVKVEDELRHNWIDSRLTMACKQGLTLIYDEFNRSRPEVNNILLSVLEEKMLILPPDRNRTEYVPVHPSFRVILTSNPEEYCGVHATQDALLDRVITINMPEPDILTQEKILIQKAGVSPAKAKAIVALVQDFRSQIGEEKSSGLRSCLIIAKVCQDHEIDFNPTNDYFRDICEDILTSRTKAYVALEEARKVFQRVISRMTPVKEEAPNTESMANKATDEKLVLANQVPYEDEVYRYLQQYPGGRFSELAQELGVNRSDIVAAVKSLKEQGVLVGANQ